MDKENLVYIYKMEHSKGKWSLKDLQKMGKFQIYNVNKVTQSSKETTHSLKYAESIQYYI